MSHADGATFRCGSMLFLIVSHYRRAFSRRRSRKITMRKTSLKQNLPRDK